MYITTMYTCACTCTYIHVQGVSRRDCGRGDTVVVNGARHTLDLVALIAYFKLKKKCQGLFLMQVMAVSMYCVLIVCIVAYMYIIFFFHQLITIFLED